MPHPVFVCHHLKANFFSLEALNMAGVMIQTRDLILRTMVESRKTIEADADVYIVWLISIKESGRGMVVAAGCFLALRW
jgi:hypothetical protein